MTTDTVALLSAPGDPQASQALFARVYGELRRLSQAHLARESGPVTVSATGLVHEAYLRLADAEGWAGRGHFFAAAARAMRQILTDRARARKAAKRGGGARPVTYHDHLVEGEAEDDQVLALDDALVELAAYDAGLAHLVELRFFGGLSVQDAADALGVSPRTAARDWARAKGHLRALLR